MTRWIRALGGLALVALLALPIVAALVGRADMGLSP